MGFAVFFVCLFQLAEVENLMLQPFSQVHLNELMNNVGWDMGWAYLFGVLQSGVAVICRTQALHHAVVEMSAGLGKLSGHG